MSRLLFDEWHMKKLEQLKEAKFPDCNKTPMTTEEVMKLKVGESCYIISKGAVEPRLMMYLGYLTGQKKYDDEFRFCCYSGEFYYKVKNVGKTYNVFKSILE